MNKIVRITKVVLIYCGFSLIVLCNLAENAAARWFILPGVFYTDEFGIVGSLAFILETKEKARIDSRLEYFGNSQGQVLLNLFIPEETREWNCNARYQIGDKEVYLSNSSSSQEKQGEDIRYWTELWAGCDFLRNNGLFYGIKAAYIQYQFKNDPDWSYTLIDPAVKLGFTEGVEYYSTFRVGLERRDNRYNSRDGYYAVWTNDIGVSDDGEEARTLIRSQIDIRKYFGLASEMIFAVNLRGGAIPEEVPYFSQFRLGGSRSLRGFPVDRYHGDAFYLLRTEFRQILLKNIEVPLKFMRKRDANHEDYTISTGFVVFSELGDLWRREGGWWGLRQSVGFGLRAIFPPDVVAAIDIATPLDSDYVTIYLDLQQSF